MHRYFVSYSHSQGFGNTIINLSQKITEFEDIEMITDYIMEQRPHAKCIVILYFQEL